MTSDRELLELAAKAIGQDLVWYGAKPELIPIGGNNYGASGTRWDPLEDDGDAFRLAVKLGIDVGHHYAHGSPLVRAYHPKGGPRSEEYLEDRYAATRRAIVRVAAEIGGAWNDSKNINV